MVVYPHSFISAHNAGQTIKKLRILKGNGLWGPSIKDVKTFLEDGEQKNVRAEEKMLEAKWSQGGGTVQGKQHWAPGRWWLSTKKPASLECASMTKDREEEKLEIIDCPEVSTLHSILMVRQILLLGGFSKEIRLQRLWIWKQTHLTIWVRYLS